MTQTTIETTMHDLLLPALADVRGACDADSNALRVLGDLVALADRVAELSEQAHRQLAARPTVTAHLGQAREHLAQLRHTLGKAEAMLAFNTGLARP